MHEAAPIMKHLFLAASITMVAACAESDDAQQAPVVTTEAPQIAATFSKTCYDALKIKAIKPKMGNESTVKWTDGSPYFDCTKGTYLPFGKGSYHGKCEYPDWLNQSCYEGTYLQEVDFETLPGQEGKLQGVLLCRHKSHAPKLAPGAKPDDPVMPSQYDNGEFDDIAFIVRNKKTGESCFFQSENGAGANLKGTEVPAPHMQPEAKNFGFFDSGNGGIDCASCHDNDPFVGSPWVRQGPLPRGGKGLYKPLNTFTYKPSWVTVGDYQVKSPLNDNKAIMADRTLRCDASCHHFAEKAASASTWLPFYNIDSTPAKQEFVGIDAAHTKVTVGDPDNPALLTDGLAAKHALPAAEYTRGMAPDWSSTEQSWEESYRGHYDALEQCMTAGAGSTTWCAAFTPRVVSAINPNKPNLVRVWQDSGPGPGPFPRMVYETSSPGSFFFMMPMAGQPTVSYHYEYEVNAGYGSMGYGSGATPTNPSFSCDATLTNVLTSSGGSHPSIVGTKVSAWSDAMAATQSLAVTTPGVHSAFTLGCENIDTSADVPAVKVVVRGVCPSLQGVCHDQDFCTDFQNDVNNCGGCDNRCASGATCVYGSCQQPYPYPSPGPGSGI